MNISDLESVCSIQLNSNTKLINFIGRKYLHYSSFVSIRIFPVKSRLAYKPILKNMLKFQVHTHDQNISPFQTMSFWYDFDQKCCKHIIRSIINTSTTKSNTNHTKHLPSLNWIKKKKVILECGCNMLKYWLQNS